MRKEYDLTLVALLFMAATWNGIIVAAVVATFGVGSVLMATPVMLWGSAVILLSDLWGWGFMLRIRSRRLPGPPKVKFYITEKSSQRWDGINRSWVSGDVDFAPASLTPRPCSKCGAETDAKSGLVYMEDEDVQYCTGCSKIGMALLTHYDECFNSTEDLQ